MLIIFSCMYFIYLNFLSTINGETFTPIDNELGFAYEFKIHVDAGREECFYQMVQAESTLYVAFQVILLFISQLLLKLYYHSYFLTL